MRSITEQRLAEFQSRIIELYFGIHRKEFADAASTE